MALEQNMKKSLRKELKSKQKGLDLFIQKWLKSDTMLTREEFLTHGYCLSHYYKTKHQFEEWKEDFLEFLESYGGDAE